MVYIFYDSGSLHFACMWLFLNIWIFCVPIQQGLIWSILSDRALDLIDIIWLLLIWSLQVQWIDSLAILLTHVNLCSTLLRFLNLIICLQSSPVKISMKDMMRGEYVACPQQKGWRLLKQRLKTMGKLLIVFFSIIYIANCYIRYYLYFNCITGY